MRSILFIFCLLCGQIAVSQSTGNSTSSNNSIPSSVQKNLNAENLYYQPVLATPSNAVAWLDYYKWVLSNKELSGAEKTSQKLQAIQSAKPYIGNSWQYSIMNFIESNKRDKTFLDAAISQASDKAAVYPYAIHYAIIANNENLLKGYAMALNELAPLSPAMYEYHYNALMSAPLHARIYAKGLTDLAPMAILQKVHGIRPDIQLKYYEQTITDTANAFICLSAGREIIEAYPNAGYSGLLIGVSKSESSGLLKQRATFFKLDQLKMINQLEDSEKSIYRNYLPSFLLLYKAARANNESGAVEWKDMLLKIGKLTGSLDAVNKMLGE
ncbi:MAG: hypothetical protein EOO13_03075 [Chitinophagaceae bacterium]|nr:MAG: hypothetical protein EOO13_03075 [Chitinophagaceae bacterium]